MTDENESLDPKENDVFDQQIPESGVDQQQDIEPEVIEKASKHGHLSREDWIAQGRDPTKWKSPQEFVEFGDSYNKLKPHLDMLKKEISKRDVALDAIVNHINDLKVKERESVRREYEAALANAKSMGDIQEVERLAQEKANYLIQQQQQQVQTVQQEQSRVEQDFLARNASWYNDQNPELMRETQRAVTEISQFYPNLSFAEVARKAEARVKYEHPELERQDRPVSPQIASNMSSVNKSMADTRSPSDDRAFNTLSKPLKSEYEEIKHIVERTGLGLTYTKQEYIADLKRKGDL